MTTTAVAAPLGTPPRGSRSSRALLSSRTEQFVRRVGNWPRVAPVMYAAYSLSLALSSAGCRASENGTPSIAGEREAARPTEAGVADSIQEKAEERVSAIPGKPIFELRLDIEGCPHDVYLNGGLVERNFADNQAHIEYQVNHFIRSGSNLLQVDLLQMTDEPLVECNIKVALRWKDEAAPSDATPVTLLTLAHDWRTATPSDPTRGSSASGSFDPRTGKPRERGELRVNDASLKQLVPGSDLVRVLSRTFELPLSFPEWAYLKSDRLTLEHEFASPEQARAEYQALLARYNELHAMLEKHDLDGFVAACEERSREFDIAYYKAPGSTRNALYQQLKNAMTDRDFELADLSRKPGKPWGHFIGSQGTLTALYQGTKASTILRYQLKDGTAFSLIFPVFLRKENGKFIVTR